MAVFLLQMCLYQWPPHVAREVIPLTHGMLGYSISAVDVPVPANVTDRRREGSTERQLARERYFSCRRADISSSSVFLERLFH